MSLCHSVRDIPLPPYEKLLLYALASRADRAGSCYPSFEQLVADTGMSRAAVKRNIKALVARGVITRQVGRGKGVTSRYTLTLNKGSEKTPFVRPLMDPKGVRDETQKGSENVDFGDRHLIYEDTKERKNTPLPPADDIDREWEVFWAAYPKHEQKHRARLEWMKLSRVDRRAILDVIPDWQPYWLAENTPERQHLQFVKSPANWLQWRGWEDDPPAPKRAGTYIEARDNIPTEADRAAEYGDTVNGYLKGWKHNPI